MFTKIVLIWVSGCARSGSRAYSAFVAMAVGSWNVNHEANKQAERESKFSFSHRVVDDLNSLPKKSS